MFFVVMCGVMNEGGRSTFDKAQLNGDVRWARDAMQRGIGDGEVRAPAVGYEMGALAERRSMNDVYL